jgi:hypothetical protein
MNEQATAAADDGADVQAAGMNTFLAAVVDDGVACGSSGNTQSAEGGIANADTVDHGRNDKAAGGNDEDAAARYLGARGQAAEEHVLGAKA